MLLKICMPLQMKSRDKCAYADPCKLPADQSDTKTSVTKGKRKPPRIN